MSWGYSVDSQTYASPEGGALELVHELGGRVLYLHCYPWDLERHWGPGVQRGLGHQGSQEHQQYQEHPAGGRIDILAQGWRA